MNRDEAIKKIKLKWIDSLENKINSTNAFFDWIEHHPIIREDNGCQVVNVLDVDCAFSIPPYSSYDTIKIQPMSSLDDCGAGPGCIFTIKF